MEGLEKFREAFEAFTHIPQIPQLLFLRKSLKFSSISHKFLVNRFTYLLENKLFAIRFRINFT